jgi:hypothetical protein
LFVFHKVESLALRPVTLNGVKPEHHRLFRSKKLLDTAVTPAATAHIGVIRPRWKWRLSLDPRRSDMVPFVGEQDTASHTGPA